MRSKVFFRVLSLVSVVFGIFLMLTSQVRILGSAVGVTEISSFKSISFGIIFIVLGLVLFGLDRKRKVE
ncbi:MAG: hypothetical protein WC796_03860 [Candidatus Pacearchaeota archaeon]|jgi:hypothetical protein